MTAIAGIQSPGAQKKVSTMLRKMAHRGSEWQIIVEIDGATMGASGRFSQMESAESLLKQHVAQEKISDSHYALARIKKNDIELFRDPLGVSPLYYGKTISGSLCFASEVKGLIEATHQVRVLPPGYIYTGSSLKARRRRARRMLRRDAPEHLAQELRDKIERSVAGCIGDGNIGSLLSGGIDSTALAAVARPYLTEFHTFAAGLPGSQDIYFAELAAKHIQSTHHSLILSKKEMLQALPEVIYYLESFDALLVRSSILNYQVAKLASEYVPRVFSGEGSDELFAGYEYLRALPTDALQAELNDITARLHNTALQRVDRTTAAHGLVAHVSFLDQDIVDLAQQIPAQYKIRRGIEKWILRKAVEDLLPDHLLMRKKLKFWQGGGIQDYFLHVAEETISDADFNRERVLESGVLLKTKEELMYYRIFKEHFGKFSNLDWVGRSK